MSYFPNAVFYICFVELVSRVFFTLMLLLNFLAFGRCNDRGEIIAFILTGANVTEKDPAVFDVLAKRLYGKLFADKGYIS